MRRFLVMVAPDGTETRYRMRADAPRQIARVVRAVRATEGSNVYPRVKARVERLRMANWEPVGV